jgi:hypothetical protein
MTDPSDDVRAFWEWFALHEARFRSIDSSRDPRLDEILRRLHGFSPKLYFEIGGAPEGPTEFIVTAEGRRDLYSEVRRLIAAAPALDGWRFIAFKPAHGFDFVTDYEGVHVDPKRCWFMPLTSAKRPNSLGLRIAVPDFQELRRDAFVTALLKVLDTALGELAAAEEIETVVVAPLPADPPRDGWIELIELPAYLMWRRRRAAK